MVTREVEEGFEIIVTSATIISTLMAAKRCGPLSRSLLNIADVNVQFTAGVFVYKEKKEGE